MIIPDHVGEEHWAWLIERAFDDLKMLAKKVELKCLRLSYIGDSGQNSENQKTDRNLACKDKF